MDANKIREIKRVISENTGLNTQRFDNKAVAMEIDQRVRALNLFGIDDYCAYINNGTVAANKEFQELAIFLTTEESYFCRDKGHFNLLEISILPELIKRRKKERKLSIWSAGCSTGQEPYSIAIVLDKLISNIDDWDISILGTDINNESIMRAKQGCYNKWSLRTVELNIIDRYFQKRGNKWKLVEPIRKMVRFNPGNLIADSFPTIELHNIDLIICRNVFIYFTHEAVRAVANKFAATLSDNGYLLVGHGELSFKRVNCLRSKIYPQATIYQRKESATFKVSHKDTKKNFVAPKVCQSPSLPTSNIHSNISKVDKPEIKHEVKTNRKVKHAALMSEAERLFENGSYSKVINTLESYLNNVPCDIEICYILAKSYANLAQHDEAVKCLQMALIYDPFSAKIYHMLAQIARDRGDMKEEKEMLNKTLYLDPSFLPAYLELGVIYEFEENISKAFKMRSVALDLLRKLPEDSRVEPYVELKVGELIQYIEKMEKN